MRQVTLVALYGQKPSDLSELLEECQKQIAGELGGNFHPYDVTQIHATMIGLERTIGSTGLNLNLNKYRNMQGRMNFERLLGLLREGSVFPFQIQIGGFQNRDYPFVSRGQRPYERAFSIQGDKTVLMGWPIQGQPFGDGRTDVVTLIHESRIYPTVLDNLRRAGQNFNILHAYHRLLTDIDNDFYFRIGLIYNSPLNPLQQQKVENAIRQFLSAIKPIVLEVTERNVYIASYEDETLPLTSTKVWPVSNTKVTADFIGSLYE
jgi:hypothetical protein